MTDVEQGKYDDGKTIEAQQGKDEKDDEGETIVSNRLNHRPSTMMK